MGRAHGREVYGPSRSCDCCPSKFARLAPGTPKVHIPRVRKSIFRRVASLLLFLAMLAGGQMNPMPMAMAPSGMAAAGTAAGMDPSKCNDCGQGSAAVADCNVMCASFVAIVQLDAVHSPIAYAPAWLWSSESVSTDGAKPDPSPPRT